MRYETRQRRRRCQFASSLFINSNTTPLMIVWKHFGVTANFKKSVIDGFNICTVLSLEITERNGLLFRFVVCT